MDVFGVDDDEEKPEVNMKISMRFDEYVVVERGATGAGEVGSTSSMSQKDVYVSV